MDNSPGYFDDHVERLNVVIQGYRDAKHRTLTVEHFALRIRFTGIQCWVLNVVSNKEKGFCGRQWDQGEFHDHLLSCVSFS